MEMNKIILWLDDIRNPQDLQWIAFWKSVGDVTPDNVVWVKTYDEFVSYITNNGLPYGICFDNDLGELLEGYDCAKFIVEYCLNNNLKLPFYKIQSANPVGYKNINTLLQNYNKFYETNERSC